MKVLAFPDTYETRALEQSNRAYAELLQQQKNYDLPKILMQTAVYACVSTLVLYLLKSTVPQRG